MSAPRLYRACMGTVSAVRITGREERNESPAALRTQSTKAAVIRDIGGLDRQLERYASQPAHRANILSPRPERLTSNTLSIAHVGAILTPAPPRDSTRVPEDAFGTTQAMECRHRLVVTYRYIGRATTILPARHVRAPRWIVEAG
jgi:hypothetical protein